MRRTLGLLRLRLTRAWRNYAKTWCRHKGPMLLYRSMNKKVCADCGAAFNWRTNKPLIKHQR